jgi:signal transduction histidine kinase
MNGTAARSDEVSDLARLSHELKTPMAAIAAFAYLIEADEALAELDTQRACVTQMRKAALQMLGMVVQAGAA